MAISKTKQRVKPLSSNEPVVRRAQVAEHLGDLIVSRLYEADDRIACVLCFAQRALLDDEVFAICQEVHTASKVELARVTEPHIQGALLRSAIIGGNFNKLSDVLNGIDSLLADPRTTERQMHEALASDIWIFGWEYQWLSSDQTLRAIIREFLGIEYTEEDAKDRPDLFLGSQQIGASSQYLLIEFKRPSARVGRTAEAQAARYADTLTGKLGTPVQIIVVGGEIDSSMVAAYTGRQTTFVSYRSLIAEARSRLAVMNQKLHHYVTQP